MAEESTGGAEATDAGKRAPVSATILFLACLKIGMTSFGGGLSGWFHREFVLDRKWVSEEEFISSLALSQILPGGNIINLLISVGNQLLGVRGAIAAVLGLIAGPFFIVIAADYLLERYSASILALDVISSGVAFAAVGLLLMICLRGLGRSWRYPERLAIIAATAIGVGVLRYPLPLVVLTIAPVSFFFAWRRL